MATQTMKVHGALFATAPRRVLACLFEKDLDFEFVHVDLCAQDHRKEPFLSLNPFGKVPVFEDGDLLLFDSRAINRYISQVYADKGTPLISLDMKKMAIINLWMEVEAQQYHPQVSELAWEFCIKPLLGMPTDYAVVEEHEPKLAKVLDVYEARLAKSKYLAGDSFSLADLHHLPTMNYLMGTRVKAIYESRPNVWAWCQDILARPAWQKVVSMTSNN